MAIFHLSAKVISRGQGQSAIAAAAYRSGEKLRDEQTDEQKFYSTRAERIQFTDIMAPSSAPEWAYDRNQLWNEAERAEKRKDAQLAREIEISLPHELTDQQREWLVKDFAREAFVRRGYVADIAIHAPDKESDARNHHAHIMVTMRTLGPDGFAPKKDRSLNTSAQLGEWREQWEHLANRHLERHGHDARIDRRSLEAQGIDREPTMHLGYAASEMAQRGAPSDRMDIQREILERNELRFEIKAIDGELRELQRAVAQEARQNRREASFWAQQEAWRVSVNERNPDKPKPAEKGLQVVDAATGTVTKLGDFVLDFLAGSSAKSEGRPDDMKAFVTDPAARKEQQLARLAATKQAKAADQALEHIREDMEAGRNLKSEDIKSLTRQHQEQIRAHGDDAVRQMVDEARKRSESYWKGEERDRER